VPVGADPVQLLVVGLDRVEIVPDGDEAVPGAVRLEVASLGIVVWICDREGYSFILLPGCFPKVTLVTGLEKFYPHFHSPR
jgi:hypothetical protein